MVFRGQSGSQEQMIGKIIDFSRYSTAKMTKPKYSEHSWEYRKWKRTTNFSFLGENEVIQPKIK